MKKHLFILAILFSMAMIPEAFAYNFQSGGIYYDITSPNTVAVTYATGSYNSYSGTVDIPSTVTYNGTTYTVTSIGNNAFRNCSNLTGVSIPGTVTSIGEYAFYQCGYLHTIDFPSNLTTIGTHAFERSGLYSVTIPASVTSIGSQAFSTCNSLTTAAFYATDCTSAPAVFSFCSHLSSLTIGNNVHNLPAGVFSSLSALRAVHIPNSVTTMGSNPFGNCANLDTIIVAGGNSVFSSGNDNSYIINTNTHTLVMGCKRTTIPNSVTIIGSSAFNGCTGLTGVLTIPNQITVIGAYAYSGCTGLTSLTIGHAVDSIGNSAFSNCSGISSVAFNADSCRYMGTASSYVVFSGCNNFSTLTIGNHVKAIPANAFYECNHLTGMLVIPNSVITIGNSAFSGCTGLTSLSLGNLVNTIGGSAFGGCSNMGGTLTIPHTVKTIGNNAFYGCTSFTAIIFNADSCSTGSLSGCSNVSSLTIGNNVKVIPANAFSNLNQIAGTLTIPFSVKAIGNSAFSGCSNLNAIIYNADSCTYMGSAVSSSVFANCNNLNSLTIGNNVKVIPNYAFYGLSTLTGTLSIPESVVAIGRLAFSNCSGLTGNLTIPPLVTVIEQKTFENCSGFSGSLVISNTVHTISNLSFSGCSGLDTLIIGKSVDTIGFEAFKNCSGLSHIEYNADLCASVGGKDGRITKYDMFAGCTNPFTLSIGENVKYIPLHLFENCAGLTGTVIVPDSITSIGQYAFRGCSGLDSLIIGKSVASIVYGTFSNCSNLSYVEYNADSCSSAGYRDYHDNVFGLFGDCSHSAKLVIGSNVKFIPSYIFSHFSGLTGKVTIPNSTHFIGDYAFYECNNLDSLVIGNSIVSIGQYAFNNCSQLSSVEFNADSCVTMGGTYYYVFAGCSHAASLSVGDNVKIIPVNAFRNFTGLTSVSLGNAVSSIGEYAFYGCNNLASLALGNSITSIPQYAFYNCSSLISINLPNTLKTIGQYAFNGCSSLTSVIIPDSVISIGSFAFHNCSNIDSIIIGKSLCSMENVFRNCTALSYVLFKADSCVYNGGSSYGFFENCGLNTTLVISDNVKHLPVYGAFKNFTGLNTVIYNSDSCATTFYGYTSTAFSGCSNFSHLTIGNNVKRIPSYIFTGCTGLSGTLIIPDSVKIIGGGAFSGCIGLDTVIIGRAVSSIFGGAFSSCTNLRTVVFNADNCVEMGTGSSRVFGGCDSLNTLIIGSNVKIIPEYAFRGVSALSGGLVIPNTVTSIGQYAFAECSSLDSLVIGEAVTSIGQYAFYNCNRLSGTLNLPNIDTIKQNTFCGCSSLTGTLTIPNSVTNIEYSAFNGCSGFDSLIIGKGVAIVGYRAFQNCFGITHLTFYADSCISMDNFGNQVFGGDTNITSLTIGENVKIIPANAFRNLGAPLSKLSGKLVIPNSVISIGQRAFNGCSGFDTLIIGRGIKSIGSYAFDGWNSLTTLFFNADSCISMYSDWNNEISVFTNCTQLTSLIIGENVKYIPYVAFSKCSHLDGTIIIPDSVRTISMSFNGCSAIDTLIIGKGVRSIGQFKDCTSLTHVTFNADSCIAMGMGSSNYTVFKGCTNISSLTIGENVKNIPNYAFYGLSNITGSLTIPDSVVSIGDYAFYGCSGYSSLSLGKSVANIGQRAFAGNISTISSYRDIPPTIGKTDSYQSFYYVNRSTPVYVPCGSAQAYRNSWTYSTTNLNSYFYNIYESLQTHQITALSEDTLKGTVQITTQATCTTPAVIEATPNFFYVFDHWSDGNTDNPRNVSITQDTTLIAYFREYSMTINCDTTYGHIVVLQAPTAENPQAVIEVVPTRCYLFGYWYDITQNGWGAGYYYDNPRTITLTKDTTVYAYFRYAHPVEIISNGTRELCEGDSTVLKGFTYSNVWYGDTSVATNSFTDGYLWLKEYWTGTTYAIDTLGLADSIIVTESGTYLVVGIDSSGCTAYDSREVTFHKYPMLILSGKADICEGDTAMITASSYGNYELMEDFSNGIPTDWTISNNVLQTYDLGGNHGNAILFPGYDLPSNTVEELILPDINISYFSSPRLDFDMAYRRYNSSSTEKLRVFMSTDDGSSWDEIYTSGSSSNIYDSFYPTDDQWSTKSIYLSNNSETETIKLKFEFSGGQGNNLWLDNIHLYSTHTNYYNYDWSNGSSERQQTFTTPGTWQVSVSKYGCTTTDSVTVNVWQPSDTVEVTITSSNGYYVMNGEAFCTSGDYIQNLQNMHGCDSVIVLHLTVPSEPTVVNDTVYGYYSYYGEDGTRASIDGYKYSYRYQMTPDKYPHWADSILAYQAAHPNYTQYTLSYDSTTNMASMSYIYIYDYKRISGSSYYRIIYPDYNIWKDSTYYDVSDTLTGTSSVGCDFTVIWNTRIMLGEGQDVYLEECGGFIWQGDSIYTSGTTDTGYAAIWFVSGDTLTESDTYYSHEYNTNISGCDSSIYLYFTIRPTAYEEVVENACESYTLNGITYTESGVYTQYSDTTLVITRNLFWKNSNWCYWNSLGFLRTYRPAGWSNRYTGYEEYYVDDHWEYDYTYYYYDGNGNTIYLDSANQVVVYVDTVNACKMLTLNLTINNSVSESVEVTACDSYTWNDSVYSQSGDYIQTLTAANGCDSVVTLHLTITNTDYTDYTDEACDSYTWNGVIYTTSDDYTQTFTNMAGCDSVVTLHLTVNASDHTELTAAACGQYVWLDSTYTESGDYSVTYTNTMDCDSIVTLHLTINPIPEVAITGSTTICPGGGTMLTATGADTYLWSNFSSNASIPVNMFGVYSVTGTTSAGCFNSASVTVLIAQPPVITITGNTDLCAGESTTLTANGGVTYMWSNGNTDSTLTVSAAGSWQVIGYDENGCNGMASTTVNVWQPATSSLYITSFDSCYTWFGTPYCLSGDYTHTLQTIHGCDSIITLHLTLEDAIMTEFSATSCNSYTWNGITYSQSGNYIQNFAAVNGNDSIVTLHLMINYSTTGDTTAVACNSFTWHGTIYTQSGNYTYSTTNAAGCDSVTTLHLTINQPSTGDTTAIACENFTWEGTTYTVSGNYTSYKTNAAGCDSIVTLHLIINQPTAGDTTAVACESFTWHGNTYTQSGNYTFSTINVAGCDSVATLHLTINQPITGDTTAVVCENFTWHGNTYSQSGNYTYTTTNVAGCDSVVTLHLTVMADFVPQVTVSGTLTACGNETVTLSLAGTYHDYLWSTGDTTATITVGTAGYYWVTIGDGTGCTSVSEPVHLGVSESVSETPALCMVGVVGNHNMVVWEELTDPDVVGYQLYRENGQANVFEPLTFVPAGIVNAYEDITADPSIRAYRYKITAVDTCGGETPMSEYHKTVHLTINQGLGNSYNLIWTPYEGFEFASYRLYRGTANNNLQLIQTMPSTLTSFTDNNPTGDALFYQIEVVMNGSCVQHTRDITFTGARSNIVYNGMPVTTDVSVSACDSYDWNGQHLTTSGDYTQSFTSQFGYDSVVTLHLTVNNSAASDFTIVTEEPCYTWNGIDYCTSGDYTQTLQTLHGCDSVVTLHLTITVGLNDYDNFDFKVYPNPTNGVVNVECMMKIEEWDNAEIHVVDMYGKLLQTKPFDGETSHVDLTRYANGFYFVKLMVEDKTIAVRKVVKE